jgi:ribosomal protein S18 acetylase RimI-like enzyme
MSAEYDVLTGEERGMGLDGDLDLAGVAEIEGVALHAWPGLEITNEDGWLLRHAAGITRRANSVWPNAANSDRGLDDRLARVESFYHDRNLPARFQICPAAQPVDLDVLLAERGYGAAARTAVQSVALAEMLASVNSPSLQVEVMALPSKAWWGCYAKADDVAPDSVAVRKVICGAIKVTMAYAAVIVDGEIIAVASAAAEAGWVGFFNVATLAEHRRIGAARATLAALGEWGQTQGATRAYLQVMAGNEAALALYGRLGFTTRYYYHYREEVRA